MVIAGRSRSKSARVFLIAGAIAVIGTWTTFNAITRVGDAGSGPAIKLVIGSDPFSSGSEIGWGVLEIKEVKEYCRQRGWGEINITVTTAVGDYFQK